ncbi:MAG: hypothetical protein KBB83_01295 [Alphaproteobacteria bacterium]|nr:hypothetical protein [Alphaproteobacteria bacterium]
MKFRYLKAASLALMLVFIQNCYASDSEDNAASGRSRSSSIDLMEMATASQEEIPAHFSCISTLPNDLKGYLCSFFPTHKELSAMSQVSREWHGIINGYIKGATIIMGDAGTGKSALVHVMANAKLMSFLKSDGWHLQAENEMPEFAIAKGYIGSDSVGAHFDHKNRELIFDCPGLRSGTSGEFRRATTVYKLLQSLKMKVRVLLVMRSHDLHNPGGTGFANLHGNILNRVVKIFPDMEKLKNVLQLVLTKGDAMHFVDHRIPSVETLINHTLGRQSFDMKFSEKVAELLRFIMTQPHRTAHFHLGVGQDAFTPREDLLALLSNRTYAVMPESAAPDERNFDENGDGGW